MSNIIESDVIERYAGNNQIETVVNANNINANGNPNVSLSETNADKSTKITANSMHHMLKSYLKYFSNRKKLFSPKQTHVS